MYWLLYVFLLTNVKILLKILIGKKSKTCVYHKNIKGVIQPHGNLRIVTSLNVRRQTITTKCS